MGGGPGCGSRDHKVSIKKWGDTKVTAGHTGELDLQPKNNGQQLGVLIS